MRRAAGGKRGAHRCAYTGQEILLLFPHHKETALQQGTPEEHPRQAHRALRPRGADQPRRKATGGFRALCRYRGGLQRDSGLWVKERGIRASGSRDPEGPAGPDRPPAAGGPAPDQDPAHGKGQGWKRCPGDARRDGPEKGECAGLP